MKKVHIPTTNQQELVGTLFYPKYPRPENPAVMFIPGWTSSEESYHQRAQAITDLGYICLTLSLRGHGQSSGKREEFSRADHLEDVLHAYDFLASQKFVDVHNISVVGASYGGYLAAVLAGKRTIHHLVLRAPAFYYNKNFDKPTAKLLEDREAEFFQNIQKEKDNVALTGIRQRQGKVLIIESEKDQIIPSHIIALYMAATGTKAARTIIPLADHQLSQGEWKQEFITILQNFFKTS